MFARETPVRELRDTTSETTAKPAAAPAKPAAPTMTRVDASTAPRETLIGMSARMRGEIHCDGALTIAGVFDGELKTKEATIEETGAFNGRLTAQKLVVKGVVMGEVSCGHLTIASSAEVEARITCAQIVIEDGAEVEGAIETSTKKSGSKAGVKTAAARAAGVTPSRAVAKIVAAE